MLLLQIIFEMFSRLKLVEINSVHIAFIVQLIINTLQFKSLLIEEIRGIINDFPH